MGQPLVITTDVVCINIPSSVGKNAWEKCFALGMQYGDIVGINEAFHPVAKDLYLEMAAEKGYGQYGLRQGGNPIFWDQLLYRFISGRVRRIHGTGPMYRSWPGFNDARFMTIVVLRPFGMGSDDSRDITVINTHWVPNGNKVPEDWREKMRQRSIRKLTRVVRRHQQRGRVVVVLGDLNMHSAFHIHPSFTWVRGEGVDKIGYAVPDWFIQGGSDFREFKAPTDHRHGVAARLRWRAGVEPVNAR